MRILLLFLTILPLAISLNSTSIQTNSEKCAPAKACVDGLILPAWQPQENLSTFTIVFRGTVYLLALLYLFLGVSIVADRFMAAIEVITSQEREVTLKKVTGEPYTVLIRVWNETVSNLTLMALGSSAPEILLSVIEIFGNHFEAGDLGPATIVGSAAYNLFVIIGICILIIPNGEVRRVLRNDVFWVTAVWSIFAYIWLYLILGFFSPNVVEAWEGILTFLFFFLTVISAYIANRFFPSAGRRIFGAQNVTSFARTKREGANKEEIKLENGDGSPEDQTDYLLQNETDPEVIAFEEHKRLFWQIFQEVRAENPDLNIKEIGKLTAWRALALTPKSRAVRRIQATRSLTAGIPLMKEVDSKAEEVVAPLLPAKEEKVVVQFQPCHYICMENVGKINVHLAVDRGSIEEPTLVTVQYKTIQDTAAEGRDYEGIQGTITFQPHEKVASIPIKIIDCEKYENDEQFHVQLYNARAISAADPSKEKPATIGPASSATIIIVDDDHAGAFGFSSEVFKVTENAETFYLKVERTRGAKGKVTIPYTVTEGRAKIGKDMLLPTEGVLVFLDGQTSSDIPIKIINDDKYEKSEDFYVQLGEPTWHQVDQEGENGADGKPLLAAHKRAKVIITEDQEFKHFIDKLIAKANCSVMVGTSSWKQQFSEALTVGTDDEDSPDGPPKEPTIIQKIIHYISLPWKIIFAFIPPTDYAHGWVCFVFSIFAIGVVTAIIGDVAAHFGCTVGLKDSVTAITLVAMGTSLPDTFASKVSAVQDKTADSSIGNVTGSNAVNVFLGIGVAWAIAAVYHAWNGTVFRVTAGGLAPAVTLFCIGSVICIAILQYRRYNKSVGGELGGPNGCRYISAAGFFGIWVAYITYCVLDAYCLI
ncbi:hypothetical protein FO519_000154 [Halicephalobus sp. NKZ332]|nr:hypothetical protein FO519_000154 [Halicephalobus sp. NKZ332]